MEQRLQLVAVNYAPIVTIVVIAAVTIWWLRVRAQDWFKGPVRTIDEPDAGAAAHGGRSAGSANR